jgi:hypothetical protein
MLNYESQLFKLNKYFMENLQRETFVLEPSTNTHRLVADKIEAKELGNSVVKLKINGDGLLMHGEHGVLKTESENVIKYVQQELDPIRQSFVNAFD